MIIAGTIRKEEKKQVIEITKNFVVMQRSRYLGKIARRQNDTLDRAVEQILGAGQNEKE